ncbi:MAG: Lrp/AsnC family transcriptional regulator [Hyphomicrobiaceae bacterium]
MGIYELDSTDIKILKELQNDGRISNADLAKRINLSPSPCLNRVRNLERENVIDRYVAILTPSAIGLPLSVFIRIGLERQIEEALDRFEAKMHEYPNVMECYLMSGESDYLIRVVVKDITELQEFIIQELSKIPGIANIQSSFSLKQVKYTTALPLA